MPRQISFRALPVTDPAIPLYPPAPGPAAPRAGRARRSDPRKAATAAAAASAALLLCAGPAAAAGFTITVDTSGSDAMSEDQLWAFETAAAFWSSVIEDYSNPFAAAQLDGILIDAQVSAIDGPSGILAQAGPTSVGWYGGYYADEGVMIFDSADYGGTDFTTEEFLAVVLHEMAHVIGFGILWEYWGAYADGSGQYTGAEALSWYQSLYDPGAAYIPVELDGGAGTANGHWDEGWAGDAYALMTGYLNLPVHITYVTLASFADIGYDVVDDATFLAAVDALNAAVPPSEAAAVPLPAPALALLAGLGCFAAMRPRARTGRSADAQGPGA